VKKFVDTPVKRYSSGMMVRLGFSVAAHMEPDILIVDEVLAVGDAEFQKKCLGKMDEVTKTAGRTILFVSHNMSAIQNLCKRCILLERGEIKMIGETKDVIAKYLNNQINLSKIPLKDRKDRKGNGKVIFTECEIISANPRAIKLNLYYLNKTNKEYKNIKISVGIQDKNNLNLSNITNNTQDQKIDLNEKKGIINLEINNVNLTSGQYYLVLFLAINEANSEIFDWVSDAVQITINNDDFYSTNKLPPVKSPVLLNFNYQNK
jgi:lipopolysaccharide transport system ATP-binding protein